MKRRVYFDQSIPAISHRSGRMFEVGLGGGCLERKSAHSLRLAIARAETSPAIWLVRSSTARHD
jgi:hypothetical protein